MNDTSDLAKSNQEQAVASWVNYLNQVRLDTLLNTLCEQKESFGDALKTIDAAILKIDLEVITTNRGGVKGMHGFIAEIAEAGVGNARSRFVGKGDVYQVVNNNGPVDLIREGMAIQQKFVAAGGRFGLGAIAEHLDKYPDFLQNGAKYQIPADHYAVIRKLHAMSRTEASMLNRSGDGPSFRDWERVQTFFKAGRVDIDSIEPSQLEYRDVQVGTYRATLEEERQSLRSSHQDRQDAAYQESRPTVPQAAKATVVAATVEGGTAFVMAVVEKRRSGTKLKDFTSDDWINIAGDTGFGFAKGGVRGFSIYALTNFTATSAAVASSIVTVAFGIAEQANRLRIGEIDELQFIENAETVALETAVSALSSLVGQSLIPLPILGAVIGNTVGMVMYKAASSSLSRREAALIERYLNEQRVVDAELAAEYQELIDQLDASMADYMDLLDRAFSPDLEVAFLGSVELALDLGVAADEVLDTDERTLAYFLD